MTDKLPEHGAVGPAAPLLAPHYEEVQAVKNEIFNSAREGRKPDFSEFSDVALGAAGVTRETNVIVTPEAFTNPGLVNAAAADAYSQPVDTAEANAPGGAVEKKVPAKKAPAKKTASAKAGK